MDTKKFCLTDAVSRIVRNHMQRERVSLRRLAPQLGVSPSGLSARLSGRSRWSLDDVEHLAELGVLSFAIEEGGVR